MSHHKRKKEQLTFGFTGSEILVLQQPILLPVCCHVLYLQHSYLYRASTSSYFSIKALLFSKVFSRWLVSINISACSICPGKSDSKTSYKLTSDRWDSVQARQKANSVRSIHLSAMPKITKSKLLSYVAHTRRCRYSYIFSDKMDVYEMRYHQSLSMHASFW